MSFRERLRSLQKNLVAQEVDCLLVEDPIDLLYLTGLQLSAGTLVVTQTAIGLFVDGRYVELAKDQSPCPVFLLENGAVERYLLESGTLKTLAFDGEKTSYDRFQSLQKALTAESNKNLSLVPWKEPVLQLRSIKDPQEIDDLRRAGDLCCRGFERILSLLQEGITEADVARELQIFWLKEGGQKISFDPIIAFGANTSKPHYHGSNAVLKKHQPVLIDIGVALSHYHSDMTRTVFLGEPNPKFKEIYQLVQEAQQRALESCQAGMTAGEIDAIARQTIEAKGYGKAFSHGLGHGVGLEVHELPVLKDKVPYKDVVLQVGMVVTIEPGIYLPGLGGVRIEDTVVVRKQDCELLTPVSKTLKIV